MSKYDGIICSIEGCTSGAVTRGWCNRHYIAWKRHGDPLHVQPLFSRTKAERFWSFLTPAAALDCWLWTGGCGKGGYGQFAGRVAHRFSYELLVGDVPGGLELDHLCRTPACVNPYHLDPVTPAENIRRARLAQAA